MQADGAEEKGEDLELEDKPEDEQEEEQAPSTVGDKSEEADDHRRRKRRAEEMEEDAPANDREREPREPKRQAVRRGEVLFRILCPNMKMGSVIGKASLCTHRALPIARAALPFWSSRAARHRAANVWTA